MDRQLKKIWICNDVLMDILPFFERVELGLTLALLSPRFDVLVDTHFNGKKELAICKPITICKDIAGSKAKLSVIKRNKLVDFPWPDRPLPIKIRIHFIQIDYIDHCVIGFLRSNKQIFDKGTNLYLNVCSYKIESNVQPIWDVLVHQIWPIFTTTNVHHLGFYNAKHLDNLLCLTSPTILSDLNINSIQSGRMFPDAIDDDDGPTNATSPGHALSKWLHTPRTDGQSKRLLCYNFLESPNLEWITNFKKTFLHATTSVSYIMNFGLNISTPIDLFELENKRTNEKLTMEKVSRHPGNWLFKRCPISEKTAVQWEDGNSEAKLNNVYFMLNIDEQCIGPLSAEEEKEGQSIENVVKLRGSELNIWK